jgi:murein DD-endopeptidase MepM/ murein hydrolase activator NlpD
MALWMLAACTPPTLTLRVPDTPVARDVPITVTSDASTLTWSLDDGPEAHLSPGTHRLDVADAPSGRHTLRVTAQRLLRSTVVEQVVTIDHDPPVPSLAANSRAVEQGHTLGVHLTLDEPGTATLSFLDRPRPLYPHGDGQRALVGVPIRTPAGPTPLTVTTEDALGNRGTFTATVGILAVDWPFTGKLPLSRRKATVPSEAIVRMRGERDPIYAEDTPDALWTGPMRLPVDGRHTSAFGTYREYPDGKRSHHDAEDIARKPGTPIRAAADGIVRLARLQAVHGNATLIAHGQGVVSLYSHQQALRVAEGDRVTAGQVIGTLGSTGRSTGPHLHWGVVVDEVPVDPMEWLDAPFLEPEHPLVPMERARRGP